MQCHLLIYKGGFIVQCHWFVITLFTDENIEIYLFICKEAVIAQWNPFVYLFTSKTEVIVQCSLIVNGMRHMLDQFSLNKIIIIRSFQLEIKLSQVHKIYLFKKTFTNFFQGFSPHWSLHTIMSITKYQLWYIYNNVSFKGWDRHYH